MKDRPDNGKGLEDYLANSAIPYESMDEVKIGHMLDQYGIPFFYKQPTMAHDNGKKLVYPTFMLPTYNNLVIEFIRNDKHPIEIQRKRYLYEQNLISAVILDKDDLKRPSWEQRLYEKLEQIYQQPFGAKSTTL